MPSTKPRYEPISGIAMPRFAGPATFMRLPALTDPSLVDIALVGVPWDGGTTNRAGPRHGPREIRNASSMIRRVHPVTMTAPYELAAVADLGDSPSNPIDLLSAIADIQAFFANIHAAGAMPLVAGGDHLVSLPVLRGIAGGRTLGMVHFDAHSDTGDKYFNGQTLTHGTPFRRAIEEGLLDPRRVAQIGIRGSLYAADDMRWAMERGVRIIRIEECHALGVAGVIAEARRVVGTGPTYLSFDIDCVDPAFAPGTGTPEVGGFTPFEAQSLVRGMAGLDLVGADVVEVSPPFDLNNATALLGATIMFEILCLLAERVAARP